MTENQGLAEMTQQQQAMNNQAQGSAVKINKKRIIWVTGGKGGTGKSTFARAVLDLLLKNGVAVVAFDGDQENAQLHRYYQGVGKGVIRTRLAERDGGDDILQVIEEQQPDVILVDVAAGGSQILMKLQDESLFLSSAREMGYGFTVVSVISPIKDSINMLREAMETTKGQGVQHVVVKNLNGCKASEFELFDNSQTKKHFVDEGGVVLSMRDLLTKTYGAIDKENLPFSRALDKDNDLVPGDRLRVRQWLTCFLDQMMMAQEAFGL